MWPPDAVLWTVLLSVRKYLYQGFMVFSVLVCLHQSRVVCLLVLLFEIEENGADYGVLVCYGCQDIVQQGNIWAIYVQYSRVAGFHRCGQQSMSSQS